MTATSTANSPVEGSTPLGIEVFGLAGRTALVTGAGGGVGAAVAEAFAAAGAAVLVTDIDSAAATTVVDRITERGGVAQPFVLDVTDAGNAREAAAAAAQLGGGTLNIVVNNAGVIAPAMFPKMDEERFRKVLDTHLMGTYHVSHAALGYLPDDGSGRIINVTSAAGLTGTIGQANYGAAKAAIIGLTKSLAKELARQSITVNAIAPLAATAMTETVRTNEKLAAKNLARVALGRWAYPDEIAPSFVFLASAAAGYITGQILPVDGGTVI
ncbi:SDR family oxidoreductase [Gordonia pseudamarae]|jgi:3-oxoacyl-[acyl-carrier protein] reductase|uniref:3-oxoacyl-[acyl-carrier-protein] reductase MabA n=1 Tax=Gordonia pseudamarae TaxID=2831662 RepID=A0ABX6INH9_9ACTN|nr:MULTISPECIES: SDR family NAD(P)-dependent oxidoreductase [Gordonia]MBD0020789.1 SDR family oxidoreductase [Gordonia sp. (in: high G+C Gram-positive bacteria)]QHN27821.1 SDR family oxidoreductase [Gordonia pseudamarae]QHN36703.1 SDR family oxidoreductase [Gordonia pseudamarae]